MKKLSTVITGTVITGTPPTHAWFEYDTLRDAVASGRGRSTPVQWFNSGGTYPIEHELFDLTPGARYYYRLVVSNQFGTKRFAVENFAAPEGIGDAPARSPLDSRLRVFVCHASEDKPLVRELCERLSAFPVDVWLDECRILPGQDWEREIERAIRSSQVALVCLSPESVSKAGFVQKELRFALDVADEQPDGSIFIVPVKLRECQVPNRLRRWQWIRLEASDLGRLRDTLKHRSQALGFAWPE
jgi:TIR domain